MEFGTRLKEVLTAKGISQRRFAIMTGRDVSYISRIINNKINVSWDTMLEFARVLDISPIVFLDNTGNGNNELLQAAMSDLDEDIKQFILSRPAQPWLKLAKDVADYGLSPDDVKRVIKLWVNLLKDSNN